jgi:gamma-glutamylcyclotransferase (GGCT)/AIG2-like uncharacterized protein YtfP
LFCYGTLQVAEVWRAVAGACPPSEPAHLPGYAGYRLAGEPFPAVVPQPLAETPGLLYQGVTPRQMRDLDAFEGRWYRRERRPVRIGTKRVAAWVYVLGAGYRRRLTREPWNLERFIAQDLGVYLARIGATGAMANQTGSGKEISG